MTTHITNVSTSEPLPAELPAGADIISRVKVRCSEGCDLTGAPIDVMVAGEHAWTIRLVEYDHTVNETESFTVKAPVETGQKTLTLVFPSHEKHGDIHAESRLVVSFATRPHATSMAVWDVPSPVVLKSTFKAKVGVRCSAGCRLAGQRVQVCDGLGRQICESELDKTSWPGTVGLCVAEVDLRAPGTEEVVEWVAKFASGQSMVPHNETSLAFTFRTVKPPEHRVTVHVVDKNDRVPLAEVEVRLGVYRALTNEQGFAVLDVPTDTYDLDVGRVKDKTLPSTVEVDRDLEIHIEAMSSPEGNWDDERVWM
jgi:hypothetical protein